jgi:hypothetical protein
MSGRRHAVKLYVSAQEHGRLLERAQGCDLPVSVYLRRLGTGYEPKSTLDAQAILSLIKVNADQGRLGGLLKLWLSARPGEGAAAFEVRDVLRRIEAAQLELRAIIKRLNETPGEPQ